MHSNLESFSKTMLSPVRYISETNISITKQQQKADKSYELLINQTVLH